MDPILLLYRHPRQDNAPTILEHVNSFSNYSRYAIINVNIAEGFPRELPKISWGAIVIHYSAYYWSWGRASQHRYPYSFHPKFFDLILKRKNTPLVMFFQDEMANVQERFNIIDALNPDLIYSLLDKKYFGPVYHQNCKAKKIKENLTGYVSDNLISISKLYRTPFAERTIDVGYRARNLEFYYGKGGREKAEIADLFLNATCHLGLNLDIDTSEHNRIYGENWYKFIGSCKFMLGAMSGTSIFDITGEVRIKTDEFMLHNPNASFELVHDKVLKDFEGNIPYRTISPRIFECAALRTCMVMFRDDYQGILSAGRNYIAIEKDFSNIQSVLTMMQDSKLVERITQCAYEDLIESGKWHYKNFVRNFDQDLSDHGCNKGCPRDKLNYAKFQVEKDRQIRSMLVLLREIYGKEFPGRSKLKALAYILLHNLNGK